MEDEHAISPVFSKVDVSDYWSEININKVINWCNKMMANICNKRMGVLL